MMMMIMIIIGLIIIIIIIIIMGCGKLKFAIFDQYLGISRK